MSKSVNTRPLKSTIRIVGIFLLSIFLGGRWIHQTDLGAGHLLCQWENCPLPPGKAHLTNYIGLNPRGSIPVNACDSLYCGGRVNECVKCYTFNFCKLGIFTATFPISHNWLVCGWSGTTVMEFRSKGAGCKSKDLLLLLLRDCKAKSCRAFAYKGWVKFG